MELKERPVVSQLQLVRDRIRVIRKILNQAEQLKRKRPPENYTPNNEECEEEDETVYQAQKNLRDLIDTLNSGKEDKYTNDNNSNDYSNDYYNEDEYNDNYSNEEYHQDRNRKKKRQLATISVQNTAFRQKEPKKHRHPDKKSSKHRNKKEIYDQNDTPYSSKSKTHDDKKRIFGLKNRNKKDYLFDISSNFKEDLELEFSDYSSSYFYCPVCSHKIHKRSKSPRVCKLHKANKKRNASTSRRHDDLHLDILSQSSTSYSSLSDDYSTFEDYYNYDHDFIAQKEGSVKHEKKAAKKNSKSGSISSYYTSTSTLLNRYGSSPSISLESSYNLYISDDDDDDDNLYQYDFSDDEDDVDVDRILKNLEKRRIHLASINDPYFAKNEGNRFSKRCQNEKQASHSNNSISLKPRYKFDDSISSSCSVLSDFLDEMSEEEKRFNNMDREIYQSSKRAKINPQKLENKRSSPQLNNNQKQRKKKQAKKSNSDSSTSKNEITTKLNSEGNQQVKSNFNNQDLIPLLPSPLAKGNQPKKVQHTVKFILEEEEEDTQTKSKSSSGNNGTNNNNKAISMVVNVNEEEELSDDIFLNSNINVNSNVKLDIEEESMLELSSENSNDDVIFMQKLNHNQKDYSIEDVEEEISEIKQKEVVRKFDFSLTKSKEEEESIFEIKNKSNQDSVPKKQTTSSSLYNDVDDVDLVLEEEEIVDDVQVKTKTNRASEEESLSIEMPQTPDMFEEEEEEDEVIMINHLKRENEEEEEKVIMSNNEKDEEEDFEEDNLSGKFNFENDELSDSNNEIENQIQNENEDNFDQKSQHKLSDFVESGSVNIADDDFL